MLLNKNKERHRQDKLIYQGFMIRRTMTKRRDLQWGIRSYRNSWAGPSIQLLQALGRRMEATGHSCSSYHLHLVINRTVQVQKHMMNHKFLGVKSEPHPCNLGYPNQIYHFWLNLYLLAYKPQLRLCILHPLRQQNQQQVLKFVAVLVTMSCLLQAILCFYSLSL